MLENLHKNQPVQLFLGLILGVGFGFFLQKGNVTSYDVIIGQLLLTDFTVLKLMLSAVIVAMILLQIMKHLGWIEFHTYTGSLGSTVTGDVFLVLDLQSLVCVLGLLLVPSVPVRWMLFSAEQPGC